MNLSFDGSFVKIDAFLLSESLIRENKTSLQNQCIPHYGKNETLL